MNKCQFVLTVLTLFGLCAALYGPFLTQYFEYTSFQRPKSSQNFNLDFFPKNFRSFGYGGDCEDLFSNETAANQFQMTDAYKSHKDEFLAEVAKHKLGTGTSYHVELQYRALHYIGSSPTVKHICETGFNAGHSTFNWLTSNDNAIVHSFDLGSFVYSRSMAEYLSSKFKHRVVVTFGNSVKTAPKFRAENPNYRCDIMFIDGDHSYEGVSADLHGFIPMASKENLIIIDDYPTYAGDGLGRAWNESISAGKVKELMRCSFKYYKNHRSRYRGFTVGTVVA